MCHQTDLSLSQCQYLTCSFSSFYFLGCQVFTVVQPSASAPGEPPFCSRSCSGATTERFPPRFSPGHASYHEAQAFKTSLFFGPSFISVPLSSGGLRTRKLSKQARTDAAPVLRLFLARCWPLASFSSTASSLRHHPVWKHDLV